uniref:Sigma-70 family RNA polymerase sigma factor n=1 Tax=Prevotella sp. GTC17253 TaxID=3236793 RepID=A0AB33J055_9BACT
MKVDTQIEACKQGNREALGRLYTTYSDKLREVCRHYVNDESIAEDILHDAFIIIFSSIRDLKDEKKLEGWMVTIVRNLALRYLRNTGKTISLSLINTDTLANEPQDTRPRLDLEQILSAIESLPNGSREIFRLSVLDGLSHQEISELLGIAPHSSSSQLFRAKKLLRAILINYWALLLLPVLIPLYIYWIAKGDKTTTRGTKPSTIAQQKQAEKESGNHQKAVDIKSHETIMTHRKQYIRFFTKNTPTVKRADSITGRTTKFKEFIAATGYNLQLSAVDSGLVLNDTLLHLPPVNMQKLIATANNQPQTRKKYPWTLHLGYSSNSPNDAASALNYLSVIDYANGGTTAKLYSMGQLIDYLNRNQTLMDSTENAKLRKIATDQFISAYDPLGEKAHHERPLTFGISVNKQLSPHWILGTGITYTRLKSEFTSDFNHATLRKMQKIDYIGIPLRMTYRVWNKGNLDVYTTGGVAFELPVSSSLSKEFTVTADSSFTIKGEIHPRYQWSVNLGVGVQYRIFKPFSLYIEPNLFYYFRNGSGIETYRTEHPFMFSIPFGLRLTW